MVLYTTFSNDPTSVVTAPPPGNNGETPCYSYQNWTFFDTTGGRHLLTGMATNNRSGACLEGPGGQRDGGDSYYGGVIPDGATYVSQGLIVYGPAGEKYDFTGTRTNLATTVEDRDGNFLTLTQATPSGEIVAIAAITGRLFGGGLAASGAFHPSGAVPTGRKSHAASHRAGWGHVTPEWEL